MTARRAGLLVPLAVLCILLAAGCIGVVEDERAPADTTTGGDPADDPEPTPSDGGNAASNASEEEGGFSDTHVFEGNYSKPGWFAPPLDEGPYEIRQPKIHHLESQQDGEAIEIGVVRPDVPEDREVPVVTVASRYLAPLDPQRMQEGPPRPNTALFDLQSLYYEAYAERYVPHGYAVAIVATRGHGGSGGCTDLLGPREQADLDQAITWLGERPWSNGNVGMIGLSMAGATTWEAAATGNPHLETIVPIGSITDLYRLEYEDGSLHGANSLGYTVALDHAMAVGTRHPRDGVDPEDIATAAVCPTAAEGLAASLHSSATFERNRFWDQRNLRPGVENNYDGSIFLVHGLRDPVIFPSQVMPWIRTLEDEIPVKRWIAPWEHTYPDTDVGGSSENPTLRLDYGEVLLHWFDYWLKEDTSVDLGPRVQVADQTGQWRSHDRWPPANSSPTRYHLTASKELSRKASQETSSVLVGPKEEDVLDAVVNDAIASKAGCSGCVRFPSVEVDEPLRLAGVARLNLTVTPTGPGGHLTATLLAEESGEAQALTHGQLDLRAAGEDEGADVVVPGSRLAIEITMEPTDAVVDPGQRLVLVLYQGGYWSHTPSIPTYPVEVHLGDGASTLELRSFDPAEASFFQPPDTEGG